MSIETVNDYIGSLPEDQEEIVSKIRQIILDAAPRARESFKWAQPVYELDGPFCYIKAFPNSVNLGFWRGVDIDDPQGLLEGSGNNMRHVKIQTIRDIKEKEFRSFIRNAIELNKADRNLTLKK